MKLEKPEVAYLMTANPKKRKIQSNKNHNAKTQRNEASASSSHKNSKGKFLCKFCKKEVHKQKDCHEFKEWLTKKGNHLLMILESFNLNVPSNTWWFDSSSMVNV